MKKQSGSNIVKDVSEMSPIIMRVKVDRDNLDPVTFEMKQNGENKVFTSSETDLWFSDQYIMDRIFVSPEKFKVKGD